MRNRLVATLLLLVATSVANGAEDSASALSRSLIDSHRNLIEVDFDSICGNLRDIFNNQCNCGNAQQVVSGDSIDCENGRLTAHAEFENFKITSMTICDKDAYGGKLCTSLYYAETIAVHCELDYNGLQCDSCFVCDSAGLLGLRVNCDTVLPQVSTNGCAVASTFLHLTSAAGDPIRSIGLRVLWSAALAGLCLWL